MIRSSCRLLIAVLALGLASAPAAAQFCVNNSTYLDLADEGDSFPICHDGVLTCQEPELQLVDMALDPPDCDQTFQACAITATVDTKFPGNHQNDPSQSGFSYSFGTLLLETASGGFVDACGVPGAVIRRDVGRFIHSVGVPCGLAKDNPITFRLKLKATMCPCAPGVPFCPWQAACEKEKEIDLDFVLPSIECPPKNECCEECGECLAVGSGGVDATGSSAGICLADTGPGARLRYIAGGAGSENLPGTPAWAPVLGRGWSHDYAERLVRDPDDSRVWLITRFGSFREFRDSGADGDYEFVSPSDETRKLRRTAGGWELEALDGTIGSFDSAGRWSSTQDRNGIGKTASYGAGGLTRVDMADGRQERFTYHPDGKLAEIVEVGVDGVTTRTWSYSWTGNDLAEILRPDGTRLRYRYEDPRHPGYMTQSILVATDASERIETAWQYDHAGRAVRIWKGDVTPGPNGPVPGPGAIEVRSMSFPEKDSVGLVTKSLVTDPLGQVSTYEFERDTVSAKPRLVKISGNCPTCGLGPNSQLFYDDPRHPMRPTRIIDARGTTTLKTYDSHGQVISQAEALGTDLERTTTWEYDPTNPALVTAIELPSTSGSGVRRDSWIFDGDGNATTRTRAGVESGSAFSYSTVTTYNTAGQPLVIDPPGYGTQDRTIFTYDPIRGDLYPATKTEPLIGTTTFEYDAFNRPYRVIDPNGVVTETTYDDLDRALAVNQKGAAPAEDLVTTYTYTPFGDLESAILPEGNVIVNGYDDDGRLTSVERRTGSGTRGERVFHTLDDYGQRVREEIQSWTGSSWQTETSTDFVYSSRCHLDRIVHADGTETEFAYDCAGNREAEWDANHPSNAQQNPPTRTYSHDVLNRPTVVAQPWGGAGGGTAVTRYEYDAQGHLVKLIDANGTETRYVISDRDLVTAEISAISGTTLFDYNEHGKLTSESDARGVMVERTVDAAGRVTFADYPEGALDTFFTFDDPAVLFSRGRLTSIERNGTRIDYGYDRFGRMTRDGALAYGYDGNGNRVEIDYPGGLTANFTYDLADRQATLSIQNGSDSPQTVVAASTYLPSGPLTSLTLGNSLTEVRGYTNRYFPAAILLPGKLDWIYSTDALGNVRSITDQLEPTSSRAFDYQDHQYFLKEGAGPWGSLAWTYDRIGNRLSETRDGTTSTYGYRLNAAGGNTSQLTSVNSDQAVRARFFYDAAGNLTHRRGAATKLRFDYDANRRLSQIRSDDAGETSALTTFRYDGRDYLDTAVLRPDAGIPLSEWTTRATYSTEGALHHRAVERQLTVGSARDSAATTGDDFVLYFAGRPVAQLTIRTTTPVGDPGTTTSELIYITTDHLGAPILTTDTGGNPVWSGGFEPFGSDYTEALESGMFLRAPGQWSDETWAGHELAQSLYYNVNRWLQDGVYNRPDPLSVVDGGVNEYVYALANPIMNTDPLGLVAKLCCRLLNHGFVGGFLGKRHCYIKADDGTVYGLYPEERSDGMTIGQPLVNDPRDKGGNCGACSCDPGKRADQNKCFRDAHNGYPVGKYSAVRGPNSNSYAGTLARKCCKTVPTSVADDAPSFNDNPPKPAPPPKPKKKP